MVTIFDIKKQAEQLADKTESGSVSPKEVGGLLRDLADYANDVEINGSVLGIRKTYLTVAAMEADDSPVDDADTSLKKGMLVNVYNPDDPESIDNNKVYSWQAPGWMLRAKLDAAYATLDNLDLVQKEVEALRDSVIVISKSEYEAIEDKDETAFYYVYEED